MTERQSPRKAAMLAIDAGAGVLIEEVEPLEQISSRASNHPFDIGHVRTMRYEQREVDLRRRHCRKRAVPRDTWCGRTALFYIRVLSTLGGRRSIDITQDQFDAERRCGPHRRVQLRPYHIADALSVDFDLPQNVTAPAGNQVDAPSGSLIT